MEKAVFPAALVLALILLILITDGAGDKQKKKDCYLLASRPGRCIYVLNETQKNDCLREYAGFEYVPQSVADLQEIRKVLYWRDVQHSQVLTGLWYAAGNDNLYYKDTSKGANLWEEYKGITHVNRYDINFKLERSKDREQVVIEITDNTIMTYTLRDTSKLPLLCEASTHPELPCPGDFKIFRPSKRCFLAYPDASVRPLQAEIECKTKMATTASINSEAENQYIRSISKSHTRIWLGMRFAWKTINAIYGKNAPKASSGDAIFVPFIKQYMYNLDGVQTGNYHHFRFDQPDFNTPNEFFILQEAYDTYWHDYDGNTEASFVCSLLPDQTFHE